MAPLVDSDHPLPLSLSPFPLGYIAAATLQFRVILRWRTAQGLNRGVCSDGGRIRGPGFTNVRYDFRRS